MIVVPTCLVWLCYIGKIEVDSDSTKVSNRVLLSRYLEHSFYKKLVYFHMHLYNIRACIATPSLIVYGQPVCLISAPDQCRKITDFIQLYNYNHNCAVERQSGIIGST